MKGKARWLQLLAISIVLLLGATAVACNNDDGPSDNETPFDSAVIGVYYNDDGGANNLLSLNDDKTVALNIGNVNISGTYEANGGNITFSVGSVTLDLSATYAHDEVTVKYNGDAVKFLRNVKYTVKFDVGAGSAVADAEVLNGKSASKPSDPACDGYVFAGWYKDSSYATPYRFGIDAVRGNITLYARWIEKTNNAAEYTVRFDLGYGDPSAYLTVTTINGKVYAIVDDPVRDGYTFEGWWTKVDNEYSQRFDLDSDEVKENIVLYALWQAPASGSKLAAPIVDIKGNRISWNNIRGAFRYIIKVTDPNGEVHPITETGTFVDYEFVTPGKYTVEVYAESMGSADNNSDITKREFIFNRLLRVSNISYNGDVLMFDKVSDAEGYLIYIDCGDAQHDHAEPIDNGNSSEYNFSDCAMQEGGIVFVIEAYAEGYIDSRSDEFSVDRTLAAVEGFAYNAETQTVSWSAVENATSYSVSVVCSDGSHNVETLIKNGTSVSIAECAQGGVTISVVANNARYNSSAVADYTCNKQQSKAPSGLVLDNMTLSWNDLGADKYEVDINGVVVEADVNSLDLSSTSVVWTKGSEYSVKVRAIKGSDVSAWSVAVNGVYRALANVDYEDGAVTWKPVFGVNEITVTVNDGDPIAASASGAAVKLASHVNTIRIMLGGDDSATETITVNAHAIAFNGNGSNDEVSMVYYANEDTINFTADISRTGYDFAGWYTTADGIGKHYKNGDAFTADEDVTLYARWDGKEYKVKLNYNRTGDELDEVKTVSVKYGEEFDFGVPTEPKTPIYGFMGWNLSRDGSGVALTGDNGIGSNVWSFASNNITVYAKWQTVFTFEKVETGSNTYYIVSKGEATAMVSELAIPAEYMADGDTRAYPVSVIGGNAFSSSAALTKITIPSSIEVIEPTAFNSCNSLTDIIIDGGRPGLDKYWSVDGVLYGRDSATERSTIVYYPLGRTGDFTIADGIDEIAYQGLKSAKIDTLYIPASVTRLANSAFESSSISEIIFLEPKEGEAVKTLNIMSGAFYRSSSLNSVTFPSREFYFIDSNEDIIENIDFKADLFYGVNSLETIYVTNGNAEYTSVDGMLCRRDANGSDVTVVFCPAGYVFENGRYETSNKITAIGEKAFSGIKTNLREVVIGPSITYIGEHAFSGYAVNVNGAERRVAATTSVTTLTVSGNRGAGLTIDNFAFGSQNARVGANLSNQVDAACNNLSSIVLEDGCNIVAIGDYAFAYSRIYLFTLPGTLTSVGNGAFKDCSQLVRIEFSDNDENITFGEDVFMNCTRLERVVLPKNITEFKGGVFAGCSSLTTIEVDPENPVLTFVEGILYGKDRETGKITSIHFIPAGVDMTNFTLPDGITEINAGVFGNAGNSIKELTISKYVTYIGANAFANTGIEKVIFLNKEAGDDEGADTLNIAAATSVSSGAFYNCLNLKEVVLPARLKSIPDGMFNSCKALASIDLSGITEIGKWAFQSSGLSGELVIPKTVEILGMQAFYSCKAITKVTFEDDRTTELFVWTGTGVTDGLDNNNKFITTTGLNVAANTFNQCSALVEVHLPEKLVNLGTGMFSSCSNLTTINIPSTVRSIRKNTFSGCSKLANLTFAERPDSTELYIEDGGNTNSGGGAPSYSGPFMNITAKNIVFPSGLVRIPAYCFYNNKNVQSVYIPNTVRNTVNEEGKAAELAIGGSAFANCSNLTSVEFEADDPDDLADSDYLGFSSASAFTGCSKLTSITLPARLSDYWANKTKTSGLAAFEGTNFVSISVMPGNKKYSSGDDGMVYNSDKTEIVLCPRGKSGKVTVPYAVTSIASNAFKSCTKVTAIDFEAKPDDAEANELVINSAAFSGCTGLVGKLTIPARVTEILDSAFNGCTKLTALTFETGSKLTEIGASAFNNCTALEGKLSIPATVEKIGEKAFTSSSGLTKITALEFGSEQEKSALAEIGANAFEKIGITSVYLPDSLTTLGNNVFANCLSIESASVPLTVDNFNGTFLNCGNLTSLTFRKVDGKDSALNMTDDGAVYSADGTVLYYYPQDAVPNKGAENEGELVIKSGVKEIAATAFAYNPNITKVTIPNTVTKIGLQAFYFMTALREVVFEEDTTVTAATELEFEEAATTSSAGRTFAGCGKLTKVNFPTRLKSLCREAFLYCTSLSDISFADNCKLTMLPNKAFQYTGNLGDVVLPMGLGRLGQYTFQYSGIHSVVIPATYVYNSSDTYTFADCANLVSVEFKTPSTARSTIQTSNYMFQNCALLASVTLPSDMKKIGQQSFINCVALTEITLPETITAIDTSAFNGCTNLVGVNRKEDDALGTVNIPAKVATIGANAFYNCSSVTNVNLLDITVSSLTINAAAFAGTGITEITIPNTVGTLNAIFQDTKNGVTCENLETVVFASGNTKLKTIPAALFQGMSNLKNVTLPKGLTGSNKLTIANNSFNGTGITSIEIPKETEKIEYSAFANCSSLATITFEKDGNGNCSLKWIGNNAFNGTGITSITIPKSASLQTSATSYSTSCFENCANLEEVIFEANSVITQFANPTNTSGAYHFRNCTSLASVTLPDGLQIVAKYLFVGCTSLESIELPASVRKVDNYAFNGCANLKSVAIKDTVVSEIGNYAFADTALTAFEAPAMLGSIGNYAFAGCKNLETVTYTGDALRTIGDYAFNGCSTLKQIVLPEGVTSIGMSAYQNCDAVTSVTLPVSLRTLGDNPFINCDNLAEIVAPAYEEEDTVRFTIDGGAVYNGDKTTLYLFFDRTVTSFTLPEQTTNIAANAFWGMPLQTFVADKENLVIGSSAFRWSAVQSVTLGDGVEIGDYAFAYCNSLTSFTIPDRASVLSCAFYASEKLTDISLAGKATYEEYDAMFGSDATLTIYGKNGVIEEDAFYNDKSLTKVVIAEGVTTIDKNAFYGTTNLTSITLPSTLKTIGDYAFRNSGLVGSIVLPADVTSIGSMVFSQNYGITSIVLPAGLTAIGSNAFAGTAITSIVIPNTVATIGESPFYWRNSTSNIDYVCDKLETVTFEANNTVLKNVPRYMFRYLTALKTVILPDHAETLGSPLSSTNKSIYADMFIGTDITSISIPATVTEIGANAFDGVSTLKEVVFERDENGDCALTAIGTSAFRNTGLNGALIIPASVTTVNGSAFYGCSGITAITFERKTADVESGKPGLAINKIDTGAFAGTAITSAELPETLVTLGNTSSGSLGVFQDCSELATVTFDFDSAGNTALKTIGYATFGGTAIEQIEIPSTVTNLAAAFVGCTNIKKIVLPCITGTGFNASGLANLPSLEEVVIPEGVTILYNNMFEGCTGIKKLVLPSTITTLRSKLFYGWTAEQTVCLTGIKAPRSGFDLDWAWGCNADLVWNYSAPEATE